MDTGIELERFFVTVLPHLNERQRRVVVGATAAAMGRGGPTAVAAASGMSRNTVIKAEREVLAGIEPSERQREPGGGDIRAEVKQPGLVEALDRLVGRSGMPYLRWSAKSTAQLAADLVGLGFKITDDTVGRILKSEGYSLHAPAIGGARPAVGVRVAGVAGVRDGDEGSVAEAVAQVEYLNNEVGAFVGDGQPVIGVAAEWEHACGPSGGGAELAGYSVDAIRRWWTRTGADLFPVATRLLIAGSHVRLWSVELARLADDVGLELTVCHLPPGTYRWKRVEHRLSCSSSMDWRGGPPMSYRVVIELVAPAADETRPGPFLDHEPAAVPLRRHDFHGDWNFTIAHSNAR